MEVQEAKISKIRATNDVDGLLNVSMHGVDSGIANMQSSDHGDQQFNGPSSKESVDQQSTEENSNEWIDVLGNGDLMKKVIRKGNSEVHPKLGELVKIVWKTLGNEGPDEQEIQFVLGYGFHAEALDLAIPLMHIGEVSRVTSSFRFVDDISGQKSYEYEIELLDVQPADALDLNIRINNSREWGNIYFKRCKYEKAYRLYDYGIKLLSEIDQEEETTDELELRKYTLISNAAACLLKLEDWKKVVEITGNLPLNKNIDKLILTKLTLRRSDALMQLKKYEEAMVSLNDCLQIDASNTRAKSLLEQTKQLHAKEEKRLDKLYKNMINAVTTEQPIEGEAGLGLLQKVKVFMLSRNILLIAPFVGFIAILFHLFRSYV